MELWPYLLGVFCWYFSYRSLLNQEGGREYWSKNFKRTILIFGSLIGLSIVSFYYLISVSENESPLPWLSFLFLMVILNVFIVWSVAFLFKAWIRGKKEA